MSLTTQSLREVPEAPNVGFVTSATASNWLSKKVRAIVLHHLEAYGRTETELDQIRSLALARQEDDTDVNIVLYPNGDFMVVAIPQPGKHESVFTTNHRWEIKTQKFEDEKVRFTNPYISVLTDLLHGLYAKCFRQPKPMNWNDIFDPKIVMPVVGADKIPNDGRYDLSRAMAHAVVYSDEIHIRIMKDTIQIGNLLYQTNTIPKVLEGFRQQRCGDAQN